MPDDERHIKKENHEIVSCTPSESLHRSLDDDEKLEMEYT